MNKDKKIFCIGFHKTGTKTLKCALEVLGYSVTGPNEVNNPNIKDELYAIADELVPKYQAFQDNPWPLIYKYLDKQYPNSKFILTVRDTKDWIKSAKKYFGKKSTPMRELIYKEGSPVGHKKLYMERFDSHNVEVFRYFKGREDFLLLDFFSGDNWEKLCTFLDKDIPSIPFPHVNKQSEKLCQR